MLPFHPIYSGGLMDSDLMRQLGPLTMLAGQWAGDKGEDVA